jgi:hypothetical protein
VNNVLLRRATARACRREVAIQRELQLSAGDDQVGFAICRMREENAAEEKRVAKRRKRCVFYGLTQLPPRHCPF